MPEQGILPIDQILPNRLFVIPLTGNPIFPGIFTPLLIESTDDIAVVEKSLEHDNMIGLLLTKDESENEFDPANLHAVGTTAKIVKKINLPDGGINIFISTLKRFKVKKFISDQKPLTIAVEHLDSINENSIEVRALTRSLIMEMKQLSKENPLFTEEMRLNMVNIDHPGKIADFITSIMNLERNEQQDILETLDTQERMEKVLVFIKKEQELMKIQKKIQDRINRKIEKNQRDYFLREELRAIQQELGMTTDPKTSDLNRYKELFKKLPLNDEAKEQTEKELDKFQFLDPNSAEYSVTRNYLETIVSLPWKNPKPENFNIVKARRVLNRDHYGLDDVKDRILEYLAVRKLKKDTKGSIICLIGPPGVGKTSVGISIAKSLRKKFFRFSVGGMRDEAEIKGHRRTYVGAMPGKIIQGLKIVKTKNPVFMIDEIDKMGSSYQGDPSSALLEALDPEQNIAFRDHYLDLPFDISQILFIVTANTLDTIPRPLIDRMEIIRLSGYISQEKVSIAKKYLIPKSLNKSGIDKKSVTYTAKSLTKIADEYAREAGMRNYEKALNKIHRKIAMELIEQSPELPIVINPERLEKYLGKPVFREDEIKKAIKPGMTIGLAWTNFGGDTLIIESVNIPGRKGEMKLTGQMGDVMKESADIAYTYIRHIASNYDIPDDYFTNNSIHLHIPEGATPKDGPSAGITMACSLFSLAKQKKVRSSLAMTGELSLAGKVMPIGGLKEKVIAARRNRIKTIIIPSHNSRDLEEIPEHVKKDITFHAVDTMEEVLEIAFDLAEKQ
ncbi:MAG: endopeptidase La [Spirochaetales bacterium]|nr:endopeptidase La [Spirochaetales bacterium]